MDVNIMFENKEKNTENSIYDIIIIGGGPSAHTAALYAARYKLKILIIGENMGGTIADAHKVCNFPSYDEIGGFDLMLKMQEQVKKYNEVDILIETVKEIKKEDSLFVVKTSNGIFKAKKIIISIGTKRKKLGLENEDKFLGKGLSYCATCDAGFFKEKTVAVIGGNNSATTSALLLAEHASKVYLIYRGESLKGERVWIDLVKENPKIEILYNSTINEIVGENKVESIKLNDSKELKVDGIFVEIGSEPNKEFINKIGVETNEKGFILVNKNQETNIKGMFAAGDCTNNVLKQVITACAEGAVSAFSAYEQLKSEK